jgi:hypothetical protein
MAIQLILVGPLVGLQVAGNQPTTIKLTNEAASRPGAKRGQLFGDRTHPSVGRCGQVDHLQGDPNRPGTAGSWP